MGNIFKLIAAVVIAVPSCSAMDGNPLPGRTRASTSGEIRPAVPVPPGKRTWISAVEFPEEYDWYRDTAFGSVNFNIVLYSGDERILSLSSEKVTDLSPDPDSHRIVGGSLYTDFCRQGETVILKDGEPFLQYKGEESLTGFILRKGKVHTLGKSRSGKGFTYRINGDPAFMSFSGEIIGELHSDGDDICFGFRLGGEVVKEYMLCRNGTPESVPMPYNCSSITDIKSIGGSVATLGIMGSWSVYRLTLGDGRSFTFGGSHPPGYSPTGGRIIGTANGKIWVTGDYHSGNGDRLYFLWMEGASSNITWMDSGSQVLSSGTDGETVFLAGNDSQTGSPFIYAAPKGEKTSPGKGKFLFPSCCSVLDGSVLAGFSTPGLRENFIWRDGSLEEMEFNGYISCVREE